MPSTKWNPRRKMGRKAFTRQSPLSGVTRCVGSGEPTDVIDVSSTGRDGMSSEGRTCSIQGLFDDVRSADSEEEQRWRVVVAAEDAINTDSERYFLGLSRSSHQALKVDNTVNHLLQSAKWREKGLDRFTNSILGSLDILSRTNMDKSTPGLRIKTNGLVGQIMQAPPELQDRCEMVSVIETNPEKHEDAKEQDNTWFGYSPMSSITQAWDRFKHYTEETWKGKSAETPQIDSHPIEKSRERLVVTDAAFCPAWQSEHHKDEYGLYLRSSPLGQPVTTEEDSMGALSQINSIDVPVRSPKRFKQCIAPISQLIHAFQEDGGDDILMHASVGGFDVVLNRCPEEGRWEVHMLDECSAIEGG